MYARCKEEECEEYATQGVGLIFITKLRIYCRQYAYITHSQHLNSITLLKLSEYGAESAKKEEKPSWYSLSSFNSQDSYEYIAKVVIISDSAIGAPPLSL